MHNADYKVWLALKELAAFCLSLHQFSKNIALKHLATYRILLKSNYPLTKICCRKCAEKLNTSRRQSVLFCTTTYSPFHSSLPFEHLGQSNLFTRVCRLFVKSGNFLFYFRTETVSQVPGVLKIYSAFIFR